MYYLVTDGTRLAAVAGRTAGHLFFIDNVFTALSDEYNPLNFTPHLWTIAFEEQIYVFLPMLFMGLLVLQKDQRLLVIAGVVLVASQPVVRLALASFYTRERAVWVLPIVHFDAVLAGLILGSEIAAGARKVSGDLLVLGAALIFAAIFLAPAGNDFSMFLPDRSAFAFTFLAVAFFLLVLGCLDERSWTARLLALPPFVFLGRISYGLYVWHWAANHFRPALSPAWLSTAANGEGPTAWWVTVLRALLVTVALSTLSFFLLERPFLRMKQRFTVVPSRVD